MTSTSVCSADHCTNNRFANSKFMFHPFPKKPEVRQKWLEALGRPAWQPPPRSVVCSAHFTADCYQEIMDMKCLRLSAVPSVFKKLTHLRPKGLLGRNFNRGSRVVKSGIKNVKLDVSSRTLLECPKDSQPKDSEDPDDVEMIGVSPQSVNKPAGIIKATPKSGSKGLRAFPSCLGKNASTQTGKETASTIVQTDTSVRNADEDLGDACRLSWQVESLKEKLGYQRIQIQSLQRNLRVMGKEVTKLRTERNMLSSRLSEETMSVVERSFKGVLQEFLQDDHSKLEELLAKSSQLCFNTNIVFKKKDDD